MVVTLVLSQGRHEYMRMAPSTPAQSYVRLADNGQRIYRGRVRASLPLGTSHKPYQTLELSQEQGATSTSSSPSYSPTERTVRRASSGPGLQLVDPAIQLHQQEWGSCSWRSLLLARWYHGNVSRVEAETALRLQPPGSYLVRNCESARKDYSLSLK